MSDASAGQPYMLSSAEGELIELVNGAAESSFVCTIGCSPETGWHIRFGNTETGKERQVAGTTFHEAWTALRHGPRALAVVKGVRQ